MRLRTTALLREHSRRPKASSALIVAALVVAVGGYLVVQRSHAATLVGDINNDGVVNVFDLSILLSKWGTSNAAADLNSDGSVNVFDLSTLLSHWGQSATPTPTPSPTATPSGSPITYSCNRSYTNDLPDVWTDDPAANSPQGTCQFGIVPYVVTGDTDNTTFVGQNVWGAPPPHFVQSIHANSVRQWDVTINEASDDPTNTIGNGGVHNYPNLGFWMHGKVDDFKTITSSWDVTIPHTSSVVGWGAYDLWFNDDDTEVMIQPEIGANDYYFCDTLATATFSGKPWHMCAFGDERVWKPGTDDNHIVAQPSGSIDIKQILTWMEGHTFVDPDTHATRQQLAPGSVWQTGYNGASFGFEIPSTSGQTVDFRVNDFSWSATR